MKNARHIPYIALAIMLAICLVSILFYHLEKGTVHERLYQGHNMTEWLKTLRSDKNFDDNPLKITRTTKNGNWLEIEIPISFDSLVAQDILDKNGIEKQGKFDLMINNDDHLISTGCERSANGNCVLGCDIKNFTLGTNHVQVVFFISNSSNRDHPLYAKGVPTEYISN